MVEPHGSNLLFVYGTLRRDGGGPAHGYLARGATYAGAGRVRGRLYDLGAYPGAVPAAPAGTPPEGSAAVRAVVHGELYRMRDQAALLALLDVHEGCNTDDDEPSEFVRATTPVEVDDGPPRIAWIYWYGRPVDEGRRIPHGVWTFSRNFSRLDR
jgi:gamma-glutamylcyclotransferase (GGCT)/AIG2-like uncharacterized protein YtfP